MADPSLAEVFRRAQVLLEAALRRLEQRATGGDEAVARRLALLEPEPVASLLRLTGEGGGELRLVASREALRLQAQAAAPGFGYALELSLHAARYALDEAERDAAVMDLIALGLTALGSRAARELFTQTRFAFELELTGVPDLGTLVLKCGLGRTAIERPEFKLSLGHDDLLDARDEGLAPHQLFMAGKMRIDGDVAKSMVLAMTLAQLE
ncbi:MAG: SCP2 sterol-binding domain-containing protein [Polyangiales bacterium]